MEGPRASPWPPHCRCPRRRRPSFSRNSPPTSRFLFDASGSQSKPPEEVYVVVRAHHLVLLSHIHCQGRTLAHLGNEKEPCLRSCVEVEREHSAIVTLSPMRASSQCFCLHNRSDVLRKQTVTHQEQSLLARWVSLEKDRSLSAKKHLTLDSHNLLTTSHCLGAACRSTRRRHLRRRDMLCITPTLHSLLKRSFHGTSSLNAGELLHACTWRPLCHPPRFIFDCDASALEA